MVSKCCRALQDWGAEEEGEGRLPSAALEARESDQNCLWEWCHRIADKGAAARLIVTHIGALCLHAQSMCVLR